MAIMATDLEKKSLETHVDLCAARYRFLEDKLLLVEEKIEKLDTTMQNIHDMIVEMTAQRNTQLINWGLGVIGTLLVMIGWLLTHYVLK